MWLIFKVARITIVPEIQTDSPLIEWPISEINLSMRVCMLHKTSEKSFSLNSYTEVLKRKQWDSDKVVQNKAS